MRTPSNSVERLLALVLLGLGLAAPGVGAAPRPSFVILLADDMGYSDAGCYGGEIATPNIDRLAANGLRFSQFYNTARCWPSRAALLTGYYAHQVRRDTFPGLGGGADGVRPVWARLLPAYLKPLGYRTYHSGKWHVDGPVLAGGFDHSYVLYDYDRNFYPRDHRLDDRPLPAVAPGSGYYSTTAIADHAIDWLKGHQAGHAGEPFLLYLCFTVPHFPLQAPPEDIALYRDRYTGGWDRLRQERYGRMRALGIANFDLPPLDPGVWPGWNLTPERLVREIGPDEVARAVPWDSLTAGQQKFQPVKMAVHAAMIHRMDTEIGRVVGQLKTMGVFDQTLVLFLSDNGASAEQIIRGDRHDPAAAPGSGRSYLSLGPGWSSAANTPLRLHKSWVHEGGISTPLIAHWPAGISARGEWRHTPGHLIDLVPTILDLAGGQWRAADPPQGAPPPPPPGRSLVPLFTKDGTVSHDYLWWYHDGNRAVRVGDWKLVADHDHPWELYDLKTDRGESHNLAAAEPARVRELEQVWTRHEQEFRALAARDLPARPARPEPKAGTKED